MDWKTKEWWIALGGAIVALMVSLGLFAQGDQQTVLDALERAVLSVAALLGAGAVVFSAWKAKRDHDEGKLPPIPPIRTRELPPPNPFRKPPLPPFAGLVLLVGSLFLLASPVMAQLPAPQIESVPAPSPLASLKPGQELTTEQVQYIKRVICCFGGRQKDLEALRYQNAEILAEIRALRAEQQRLLTLLEYRDRDRDRPYPVPPPMAPQPTPPPNIIIIPPGRDGTPRYEVPPGGTPRYELPPGGYPRYEVPPGGYPRYEVPPGGYPRYEVPPGTVPRYEVPPGGTPRYELVPRADLPPPASSKEVPLYPGSAKPNPNVPGELRIQTPPNGYIRYTRDPRTGRVLYQTR